jgi:hypothetical protein
MDTSGRRGQEPLPIRESDSKGRTALVAAHHGSRDQPRGAEHRGSGETPSPCLRYALDILLRDEVDGLHSVHAEHLIAVRNFDLATVEQVACSFAEVAGVPSSVKGWRASINGLRRADPLHLSLFLRLRAVNDEARIRSWAFAANRPLVLEKRRATISSRSRRGSRYTACRPPFVVA